MRRLTFVYRQGKIELISDQEVDMTLPKRASAPPGAQVPFWYELRDGGAGVLQRLPAPDPIPVDTEVFSDDPRRTIQRAKVVPPEVVFTVVIPDLAAAKEVRLMRAPPPGPPGRTRAGTTTAGEGEPVELGRFKLATKG